jgi:cytochrome c oxidase subunit III
MHGLACGHGSAGIDLPDHDGARVVSPYPRRGLTIQTNLFGTTYYSLVGLHATHVVVGLIMLSLALGFSLFGLVTEEHSEKLETLSLYWHFVDAVWVVVFTVVYVLGR